MYLLDWTAHTFMAGILYTWVRIFSSLYPRRSRVYPRPSRAEGMDLDDEFNEDESDREDDQF
jgi:hypothetical protein